jgi:phospholipid transport system substrate-binding protein
MRRRMLQTALSASVIGLCGGRLAFAADAQSAGNPRAFIDTLGAEVLKIIQSPNISVDERKKRFRELFHKAFDVQKIGRFVVGRYWNQAKPDEQQKYIDVFGDYVSTIYANQFSTYQGQSFKTTGMRDLGEGESLVQSEIDRPGNAPMNVAFRVGEAEGQYKITDVTVEGVSLIVTKRGEFGGVLAQEGVPGVTKRMQSVVNQG